MNATVIVALARRPLLVVGLALAVTSLAIPGILRLRVRADLETLLPAGSPAAESYRTFLRHFGGLEQVFVLILADNVDDADPADRADAADLAAAAGLLEEILGASPEVASASAGLSEADERFFLRHVAPRAPLLIAGADWAEAVARRIESRAIRDRVARLKAGISGPGGLAGSALARSDPLGFTDELPALRTAAALPIDPLTSTFLAPGGDAALVVLTPTRSELDPQGGRVLSAELEAAFDEVRLELDLPLDIHAIGGPLYAAQDERLLRQDLRRTLTGSLAGASALLIAAFEGLLLPLAALVPLAFGLLWTAGWIGLATPEVTAIAIGFGAVLVGLGLDYGIHAAARFRQAYLAAPATEKALGEAVRHTGPGIVTSALTTAAAFAVLGQAHFRPLEELGTLVALGILSILAALALLGGPASMLVAHRLRRPGRLWRLLGRGVEAPVAFAGRRSSLVLTVAAGLSVLALVHLPRLAINPDLRALRPFDHPAHETEALLVGRFGLGLDTANVVIAGRDLSQALERAARIGRELRRELGQEAEISNPSDHLALGEPAADRLRQLGSMPLARAAGELERELERANLNPRAFGPGLEALRAMGRGEDPGAPSRDAWPDWLARSLAAGAAGDEAGAWATIGLRLPPGTWPEGPPRSLEERIESMAPGSVIASAAALGPELRSLAAGDLKTLSLLALALVAAVVAVSFRGRLRDSALAGLPVVLGTLWTLGLWAGLGRSLDLFTLAVLPIMLGIGIDDGLHVMHGARRRPSPGLGGTPIAGSVRGAGRALVLTTLTTAVGFGSLVLSHIPGLRNGGLLIAAGVLACLLATLMVLPAIEAARNHT